MLFGKKKEKSAGLGGLLSIVGGIVVIVGFVLPLIKYDKLMEAPIESHGDSQKHWESIAHMPADKADETPSRVSLFGLAKKKKILYLIPGLGLIGVFVGFTLFKMAILNVLFGGGVIGIALFAGPAGGGGLGSLFKFGSLGLWATLAGGVLLMFGGFMTKKKNSPKKKKKKKKKKK